MNVGGNDLSVYVVLPKDATGTVIVSVDGKKEIAVVSNGHAEVVINNLTCGNHSVEITYSGDDKYDSNTLIKNITVIPVEFKLNVMKLLNLRVEKISL